MTREQLCARREEVIQQFSFDGRFLDAVPYGSGHINDTFLVRFQQQNGDVKRYILQRMNQEVFRHP